MMPSRWRRTALVTAAVSSGTLLVGYAFAGVLGLLAVVTYLACILAPGVALYGVLAARFRSQPSTLLEFVFYSNVLGFALVEGSGWVLARSGGFSLPGLLGLEAFVPLVGALTFRRALRERLGPAGGHFLTIAQEEVAYFGIAIASAFLLLLPLFLLLSDGFFVGTDTITYPLAGWLVATTGHWPSLSRVLWPNASAAAFAPGAPIVYALYSAVTGVYSPPMATVLSVIPVALTPIGLCLLVRRYSSHPLLVYGLPLVWLVGTAEFSGFFYNNVVASIYTGSHPEVTLSLPFLVAVLILLVDFAQRETSLWFETTLLSGAVLATVVASQLSFIFVVGAFLFFGIGIAWRRGVRWSLVRLGVIVGPTLVAWPLYLIPQNIAAGSPATGSVWNSSNWQVNWTVVTDSIGILTEVGAAIVALTVAAVLYERLRKRPIGSASLSARGIFPFIGLGLIGLYLGFSNVPSHFLGITSSRFLAYASLMSVPVVAVGFDRLFHLRLGTHLARRVSRRWRSAGPILAAVAVAALLGSAAITSLQTGMSIQAKSADSASLVTPSVLEASQWIKEHVPPSAVLAVDANGGNVGAVYAISGYSGHVAVIRLRSLLYNSLHFPPPQNISFDYVNRAMTDPTEANAAAAASLGIDYYVFQVGFSGRQIAAFSLLPYFSLVYHNSQIHIFEYVGGNELGFVPAISYCSAGAGIVSTYSPLAYSYAASFPALPESPNWVTSTASYPAGSLYVNYCENVPATGNYTLYVHRDAFGVSQFINVSLGGPVLGQVYFPARGLTLGTPLTLNLPAGPITLRLSFEGNGGTLNPVDYLVLAPELPV